MREKGGKMREKMRAKDEKEDECWSLCECKIVQSKKG